MLLLFIEFFLLNRQISVKTIEFLFLVAIKWITWEIYGCQVNLSSFDPTVRGFSCD